MNIYMIKLLKRLNRKGTIFMNKKIFDKNVRESLECKEYNSCSSPKVSVIIPVYKVERYLTKCFNSIISQTMKEIEIIIVDEGEQDRCREIIDYFEEHDSRVVAPHKKNGGYGAACNLGIKMARGEYITIVESDDFIEPEMCEEMYNYAKKMNAEVLKTPYYEYFDGSRRDCSYRNLMADNTPQNGCFSVKQFGELLKVHASLWTGLYETSYIREKNIFFIEAKGAAYVDVGFRIDTLINTDRVVWLDKPFYNYRVDSIGSSTNNFNLSAMIQRWKEEHELFSENQEDYEKYYGPQLILDEYYNTVGWLWLLEASKEQYTQIAHNLSYISEKMVKESPSLNKKQKRDILELKRNPIAFRKKVIKYRMQKKYGEKLIHILDKLSDIKLMNWMFIGFLTITIASLSVYENKFMFALADLFLIGIGMCFCSKFVRKLLRKFISFHLGSYTTR